MKTTDYLNAVKNRYMLTSDYQLAHKLGLTRGGLSSLRLGKSFLNDDTCTYIAQLLDLPPALVMAHVNIERETRAKRENIVNVWLDIAAKFSVSTAASLVLCGLALAPAPAQASTHFVENGGTLYIMSTKTRKMLLRLLFPIF